MQSYFFTRVLPPAPLVARAGSVSAATGSARPSSGGQAGGAAPVKSVDAPLGDDDELKIVRLDQLNVTVGAGAQTFIVGFRSLPVCFS